MNVAYRSQADVVDQTFRCFAEMSELNSAMRFNVTRSLSLDLPFLRFVVRKRRTCFFRTWREMLLKQPSLADESHVWRVIMTEPLLELAKAGGIILVMGEYHDLIR